MPKTFWLFIQTAMWNSLAIPQGESHNYKILVPYFALLLRDVYNLNSIYPSKYMLQFSNYK